jgi:hypothetical protein
MQNYTNYHVVYIDDASQDDTSTSVKEYMKTNMIPVEKMKLIIH